jgi:hypothetical protein
LPKICINFLNICKVTILELIIIRIFILRKLTQLSTMSTYVLRCSWTTPL